VPPIAAWVKLAARASLTTRANNRKRAASSFDGLPRFDGAASSTSVVPFLIAHSSRKARAASTSAAAASRGFISPASQLAADTRFAQLDALTAKGELAVLSPALDRLAIVVIAVLIEWHAGCVASV